MHIGIFIPEWLCGILGFISVCFIALFVWLWMFGRALSGKTPLPKLWRKY